MSVEKEQPKETAMTTEIERKFTVDSLPNDLDLSQFKSKKIDQGYLANGPEGAVRVRRKGDAFYLTFKSGPTAHAAERVELECEITKEQFDTMWPGTAGRRIEKTRYEIPHGEHTIELDVFEGENAGHMLAEVEFASTTSADMFTPPEWFGMDVTADKRFGNAMIAESGFPTA